MRSVYQRADTSMSSKKTTVCATIKEVNGLASTTVVLVLDVHQLKAMNRLQELNAVNETTAINTFLRSCNKGKTSAYPDKVEGGK